MGRGSKLTKEELKNELRSLSDEDLKIATLERDEKKRFTARANMAYEIQRERHHAQASIGMRHSDRRTASGNMADVDYYGCYTD